MDKKAEDKIELEIVALSHNMTQQHTYAVVLGEVNGLRRLPIVIGGFEAQAIAVALEGMHPSRPLTHDLIKNIFHAFGVELQEVIISDLIEGVFYAKLICQHGDETIEIDSRTSDALALAVRFECPIYTYNKVMDAAGILLEEPDERKSKRSFVVEEKEERKKEKSLTPEDLRNMTLEELQKLLEEVLEREDYIQAIAIRDEINRRKKKI
ncbi:MAG: bifunctional nuclease family protein [Thermoflavifilum sp.]|jgi:bifunctional DNase/RNase|uniref:bifunctional nuclease family protein n=1 Tax=Thermoflavifilum sp. TaxID=1968839 RepID=UPI0018A62DA0|nr:bifunctional nuclease family protein [Thermoflavifilum sp.]QOR75696.1 MAG: bifunctional nuclease family protein [Thermoflavifilum sp.]